MPEAPEGTPLSYAVAGSLRAAARIEAAAAREPGRGRAAGDGGRAARRGRQGDGARAHGGAPRGDEREGFDAVTPPAAAPPGLAAGYARLRGGEPVAVRGRAALIWVEGPDAGSFLHGLLSNDVAALAAGGACPALLLDAKGHVRADMRVRHDGDGAYTVMVAPALAGRGRRRAPPVPLLGGPRHPRARGRRGAHGRRRRRRPRGRGADRGARGAARHARPRGGRRGGGARGARRRGGARRGPRAGADRRRRPARRGGHRPRDPGAGGRPRGHGRLLREGLLPRPGDRRAHRLPRARQPHPAGRRARRARRRGRRADPRRARGGPAHQRRRRRRISGRSAWRSSARRCRRATRSAWRARPRRAVS